MVCCLINHYWSIISRYILSLALSFLNLYTVANTSRWMGTLSSEGTLPFSFMPHFQYTFRRMGTHSRGATLPFSFCLSSTHLDEWVHFQGEQLCHLHFCRFSSGGQLLKERICSYRSKFFLLRADPIFRKASTSREANK